MVFHPRGAVRRQPNGGPNMNQDYDSFGENMAQGQYIGGNAGNMGRSAPSMPSRNPYTTYESQRSPRQQHYGAQPAPNAPKVGRPFNPRGQRPHGVPQNQRQFSNGNNSASFAHAGAPSPAGRKPFSDNQRAPRGMPVDPNVASPRHQTHSNTHRGTRPPMARPTPGHTPQQHQQPHQAQQRPMHQQPPMHPRARPMLRHQHPRTGTPARVDNGAPRDSHEQNADVNLEHKAPRMSKAAPAAPSAAKHTGGGNPPPGVFGIGAKVQVDGLVSAAKYNGCEGRVSNFFPDKQRWEVTLNYECETKVLALKRSNCILKPSCGWTVLVSNCPPAPIEKVSPHFAQFGVIKKIDFNLDFACCMVEYVTRDGALACLKEKQQEVLSEPIIVQWLPSLKREMNSRDITDRRDAEKDETSRPSVDRGQRRSRDAESDDDTERKKRRTEDDKDYLSEEDGDWKASVSDRKRVPTADDVHDNPFAVVGEFGTDVEIAPHVSADGACGVGKHRDEDEDDGGDYEDYEDYDDEELEAEEIQQPTCDTEELLEELAVASGTRCAQSAEQADEELADASEARNVQNAKWHDDNDEELPSDIDNDDTIGATTETDDVCGVRSDEKLTEAEMPAVAKRLAREENTAHTVEEEKENTVKDLTTRADKEASKVEEDGLPDDEQVEQPRKRARISKWENEEPVQTSNPEPAFPLPSIDEIKAMSIKSLKELLTRRHVDFTGCLEKPEIRAKALKLHDA